MIDGLVHLLVGSYVICRYLIVMNNYEIERHLAVC